ncbi:hypothetical protein Bpfe_011963 [Biomphalaria pfeifferi]|uniref:Uncharacterized protein n=1 Tax=Biomphalaria pfeifferi TaxID=112525 RepID=A0AAD8BR11_BIOPF|nr:hypothetical protein Bpfe_011963 [Biomphalaria pfeifferi]
MPLFNGTLMIVVASSRLQVSRAVMEGVLRLTVVSREDISVRLTEAEIEGELNLQASLISPEAWHGDINRTLALYSLRYIG